MTAAEFVSNLGAKAKPSKTANGWECRCPAHEDTRPSLSVSQGPEGVLIHCHAGCTPDSVCSAAGLKLADLFTEKPHRNGKITEIVEIYDYRSIDGKLVFQVVRYWPKDFKQRRPDPQKPGKWIWNTEGVEKILFRLPEITRAIQSGSSVFICEGEKDVLAMEMNGVSATCNPGGANKWQDSFSETLRGANVVIIADKDEKGREHAQLVAGKLHGIAKSVRLIELPDIDEKSVKDAADFFAAGGNPQQVVELSEVTPEWVPAGPQIGSGQDDLQRVMADARPKLRLPGNDRLLSDFADELAQILREQDIFWRNGEIVTLAGRELKPMVPQTFRCWAEQYFVGYRAKTVGENSYEFDVTMTDHDARGTLAAPQFADALRHVRCLNRARLPIFEPDGKLSLLPNGYHTETQTLTVADVEFDLEMPLNIAVETVTDLLAEFCFDDGDRSKAVVVAAMMGLFANQLLREKSLRPCFIFVANAEGAGKTLLAQICMVPTLGSMPIGSKPDDEDEMRKTILTAVREAQSVIFLDNLKGRLSSEPLEAFLSAPEWKGRKLGVNETLTGENLATVFCTGNGMTVSPDMRRRSLFVELRLEAERAEDRQFKRTLDLATLLEMRPQVLAALWSMVKNWDALGRPGPSRGHSAFPSWANIIGGIVEAAGFSCPLETPNITAAADPDSEDMQKLVQSMADTEAPRKFSELIELAHEHGLFEHLIGTGGEELGRREKSAFSKMLGRYDRRLVLKHRFIVEGKGKTRLYKVENGNGRHGQNGVPV